jgi:ATP-dependent DNA helicase PIF1
MSDIKEMIDPQYQIIYDAIKKGYNIILYGFGGSGKSTFLKWLAKQFAYENTVFALTALTGIASISLNENTFKKNVQNFDGIQSATTLHSWAGIGKGDGSVDTLYAKIIKYKPKLNTWKNIKYLIIDEFSMLGSELFGKLNILAKRIRKNDLPFGGIQLIFSGDILQLTPIGQELIFKSEFFDECNFYPFSFSEPRRFNDPIFFQMLMRARVGKINKEDIELLKARQDAYDNLDFKHEQIQPTRLYPINIKADSYNQQELDKIQTASIVFNADDGFIINKKCTGFVSKDFYINKLEDMIPKIINLKIGAQVMLKVNLDISQELVNGSRGIITDIICSAGTNVGTACIVKFKNSIHRIEKNVWDFQDTDAIASRSQIPLILAWATSIHRCQGLTLESAVCDIGKNIFTAGQTYVSLSRVRNFASLYLSEFDPKSVIVDQSALTFEKEMKKKEKEYETKLLNDNISKFFLNGGTLYTS